MNAIQIRYIQVLMYKNRKGQKTKPNQDKKESHMTHWVPTQIAEIISATNELSKPEGSNLTKWNKSGGCTWTFKN